MKRTKPSASSTRAKLLAPVPIPALAPVDSPEGSGGPEEVFVDLGADVFVYLWMLNHGIEYRTYQC